MNRQRGAIWFGVAPPVMGLNPLRGERCRSFTWAVERERNMSCVYSHACVSALAALALAVYSIPLVLTAYFLIKRVIEDPRAAMRAFAPLLLLLGVLLLSHGVSGFIGPDGWTGLIYILAGAR